MSERACNRISLAAAVLLAAGILAGIVVPAGPGWDFGNFYDAGHKILAGQIQDLYNPNVPIEGRAPQGQLAYYGAPITAALFAAIAWMTPGQAMAVFKVLDTAVLLIGLWLLYRQNAPIARKTGMRVAQYRAAFLVAMVLFQPFWTIYRVGGQTTPILFLGLALALGWLTSGRLLAAAVCLVAVVAIKPAFSLTLILIAVFAGWRFLAYTAAAGLSAAGLSILTMGWGIHQRFLEHIGAGKLSGWPYNSSITVVFDNFRGVAAAPDGVLAAAATATRLLAAGLVLTVLLRGRKRIAGIAAKRHFLVLLACGASLLLMPVVWEHYLSVLFLPAAYLLAILPMLTPSARRMLALLCACCVTQNLIVSLWLRSWVTYDGAATLVLLGLYKSVPLILFTMLVWRHQKELVRSYETTAAVIAPPSTRPDFPRQPRPAQVPRVDTLQTP